MPIRVQAHRHPGLWSAQSVPPAGVTVEVDPTHPLSRDLLGFYTPGITNKDLAGRCPPLVSQPGQLGGVPTPVGPAFGCANAAANGILTPGSLPTPDFTRGATLWCYRVNIGSQGNTPLPWIIALQDGSTRDFALYSQGGTDLLVFLNGNFYGYFPAVSGVGNDLHTLGTVFTPSTSVACYHKGVQAASALGTTDTTVLWSPGTSFQMGIGGNMNVIAAGVWTRPLSAAEFAWLDREPFAMLRPAGRRRVFAKPAAVAAGYRARIVTWS